MASPQIENGRTEIANEILERLVMMHLSGNELRIILCLFRKTYGWHKKTDYISNCQIIDATGLSKSVISRSLAELEGRCFIERKGKNIGFQKDWERWENSVVKVAETSTKVDERATNRAEIVDERATKVDETGTKVAETSTKVDGHIVTQKKKETIQKKLIQKKYGEFQNVTLSDEEYEKLKARFNGSADDKIENLSHWLASTGNKKASHYATILSWSRKDELSPQRRAPPGAKTGNGTCTGDEMDEDERRLGLK